MFNACRRGPASITRVLRAASSTHFVPSIRTSTTSLSLRKATFPAIGSRLLHLSSRLNQWSTGAAEGYDESVYQDEEVQASQGKNSGPLITRFDELIDRNLVHPNVVEMITKRMGHHTMTEVQTATINQGLEGTDIIAQARTGTGKTLGFLIPTIQNILKKSPELAERQRYTKARPSDIRAIIISPTRELAEQIAVEAEKLCQNTDLRVQVAVGGNNKRAMLSKMQREGCHLLVATPGRLNDILTDPYSRVAAPALNTIVLDEADRLLDSGFAKDIEDIIEILPKRHIQDRQTLMFSATVPREVMGLVRKTLKPDFHFVQTVKAGDLATHEKIPQKLAVAEGYENYMPTLLELCKREIHKAALEQQSDGANAKPFKAIVYFSSTANVVLGATIFENLKEGGGSGFGKHPLWPAEISQMHGQLTQQQRTRVSERFRRAKSAIMFSTDVTARGMDFPGVTHVIQMGLPPNRDQYVHRIGRTGRGDNTGEGWIVLAKCDIGYARRILRGLPIMGDGSIVSATVDMTRDAQLPAGVAATLQQVGDATKMVDRGTKAAAYLAAIGQISGGGEDAVQGLNQWARFGWGWEQPPAVSPSLARKLGISRVPGMNIGYAAEEDAPKRRDSGFGGRGGGRYSGGRDGGSRGSFGGDRDGGRDRGGFGGDRDGERSRGGFGGRGARGPAFGGQGRRDYGGRKSGYGDRDLASF